MRDEAHSEREEDRVRLVRNTVSEGRTGSPSTAVSKQVRGVQHEQAAARKWASTWGSWPWVRQRLISILWSWSPVRPASSAIMWPGGSWSEGTMSWAWITSMTITTYTSRKRG